MREVDEGVETQRFSVGGKRRTREINRQRWDGGGGGVMVVAGRRRRKGGAALDRRSRGVKCCAPRARFVSKAAGSKSRVAAVAPNAVPCRSSSSFIGGGAS
eukprot:1665336-Pleurochrysis_carterae.AAC.1